MKHKFSKILGVGLTLALLISMLVMAAPVQATATAVTDVYVDFLFADTQNIANDGSGTNEYLVHFKPYTALVKGEDWVTVTFPDGVDITMGPAAFVMGAIDAADATFSTDFGTAFTATWKRSTSNATITQYRAKVLIPIDVAAGADVWLSIDSANIQAPNNVSNAWKVYVQTTKDTTRVRSSAFSLDTSVISDTNDALTVAPNTAGVAAEYKFTFRVGTAGVATMTAILPMGVGMPSSMDATEVLFSLDGTAWYNAASTPVVDVARRRVTAVATIDFSSTSTDYYMKIIQGAGVTNPELAKVANTYRAMLKTDLDGMWAYVEDATTAIVADTATKIVVANGQIGLANLRYSDDASMINMYSSQIFVTIADQYGNAKDVETTVNLTTSGTGAFFTNAATSGADGWTEVTSLTVTEADPNAITDIAYYKGTAAGTVTLTFTDNAASLTLDTWTFKVADVVSLYDSSDNLLGTYGPAGSIAELGDNSPSTQKYGVDYINAAITASGDGDTVKLGDGIYELDVPITLDKAITLTSVNGAASTTLRNTTNIQRAIEVKADGTSANPLIIDGFTFQRLRSGVDIFRGVYNESRNYVTVRNNIFNNIEPDANKDSAVPGGVIVTVINKDADRVLGGSATSITSATVSNNTINNSVTVWPGLPSPGGKAANIVFIIRHSGTFTITGVTISDNTITDSLGYGIVVGGQGSSADYVTANIKDNTITNGMSGIVLDWNTLNVKVTGNTVTGAYGYALKVETLVHTGAVIKNNTFTGSHGSYGVAIQKPDHVTLNYNDISGNAGYSIKVTGSSETLDAKYNWYGSASGPGTTVSVATGNTATTSPWLHKSLADVVADNASYPTFSRSLAVGWNTLSVPAKLISSADALNELVPDGRIIAYKYDGGWVLITTDVINPLDAIYIKMSSAKTVLLKVDGATTSAPTKSLAAGWNMIGLASITAETEVTALASLATTSYGLLVSPSMNAEEWVYVAGASTAKSLAIGEGYWIFMKSAATIAGLTILPMAPSLN